MDPKVTTLFLNFTKYPNYNSGISKTLNSIKAAIKVDFIPGLKISY